MKTVYIIRHAKSCWNNNLPDHKRPIKQRGINDAHLIGEYLKRHIDLPESVFCSSAKRAKLTADIILSYFPKDVKAVNYKDDLYDFSGEQFIKVVKQCDENVNSLLIFGHNYAITNFVNTFGDRFVENVPTAGCVRIEFNSTWKSIQEGKTTLMVFPKNFK